MTKPYNNQSSPYGQQTTPDGQVTPQGFSGAQVPTGQAYGQPGGAYPQQQRYVYPGQQSGGYAQYANQYYQGYPAYAQYAQAGAYAQPQISQQAPPQKKRRRGKGFWIGIIIAALLLIAAGYLAYQMFFTPHSNRAGDLGQLDGKTDAEIQAELDRIVEEGMFNISIASVAQFQTGTSQGELKIENVPGNPYLMQVVITRDDTGEQIYESGILEQNHHIQRDSLDVDLPAGNYQCTATFYALDPDTEEEVGQAAAQMQIQVLS